MKIVIAPDSFKGALDAPGVANALADGWRSRHPEDELCLLPLADGGEGSCRIVTEAMHGNLVSVSAHDPLMRECTAQFGDLGDSGMMEMASASGIELLTPGELNPFRTTTFGSGEVFRRMLDDGHRDILIGIGGSATIDGGAGFLQALGAEYFTADGRKLPPGVGGGALAEIARIDLSHLDCRLPSCRVRVGCDVNNPLLGERGAVAVFGPQKGANTPEQRMCLEHGLRNWSERLHTMGYSVAGMPGDGAAGGLGFLLRSVLGGRIASGAELIMEFTHFQSVLSGAALLLTGEGCSDEQTLQGKLCGVIAKTARSQNVPTVLISGSLRGDSAALSDIFLAQFSISDGPGELGDAMKKTRRNLARAGANLAALIHCR